MKEPMPLSPAARQLLEAGIRSNAPSPEESERMHGALAPYFRAPPLEPAAGGGPLSGPLWGARQVLGVSAGKLALAVGALAVTASAAFWAGRLTVAGADPGEDAASTTLTAPLAAPGPAVASRADLGGRAAVTPLDRERPSAIASDEGPRDDLERVGAQQRPALATVPAAVARVTKSAPERRPGVAVPAGRSLDERPPSDTLGAEVAQLGRVEAALRRGRPAEALAALQGLEIRQLAEQATALRAIARCEAEGRAGAPQVGAGSESAELRALLERWPHSAFAARVRRACGG